MAVAWSIYGGQDADTDSDITVIPLQVEILSEGDSINELMILVGGMVEVLKPGKDGSEELTIDIDGHNSIRGGYARQCVTCRPWPFSALSSIDPCIIIIMARHIPPQQKSSKGLCCLHEFWLCNGSTNCQCAEAVVPAFAYSGHLACRKVRFYTAS